MDTRPKHEANQWAGTVLWREVVMAPGYTLSATEIFRRGKEA